VTAPPSEEQVTSLTWSPRLWHEESEELRGKPAWQNYRYLSIALLLTTAVIVGAFW
jgi:solute:Na+ symporter, SSS family